MSAYLAEAIGDSLAMLAERDALTLAQRNYRSAMLSSLLACQLRALVNASVHAVCDAGEQAADAMAYEIGTTVLDMRRRGADDSEQLDGVMALVRLRMITSLDSAVDELAGGEPGLMARNRRYRRRGPRVYVRAHVGCLGCSVPLLAVLAVVVAAVGLVLS